MERMNKRERLALKKHYSLSAFKKRIAQTQKESNLRKKLKRISAKVDAKVFVQDKIVVVNIEGRDGKLSEGDKRNWYY